MLFRSPRPRSSGCTGAGEPRGAISRSRSEGMAVRRYPSSKVRSSGCALLEQLEEIPQVQGKRNPSKIVGVARGHQRANTLKPYSHKTSQSNHARTTTLSNSMKLSHALWGHPRRAGMVERSDRMWSTGEGNGKPLQYSCLENSMDRRAWGAITYDLCLLYFYYASIKNRNLEIKKIWSHQKRDHG